MIPAPNEPPTSSDLSCRTWKHLPDAVNLYRAISDRLKNTGFILSVHGSAIRELCNEANDLDLIATQWNRGAVGVSASPKRVIDQILLAPGLIIQTINRLDNHRMHAKIYYQPEFQVGDRPRIVDLLIVTL